MTYPSAEVQSVFTPAPVDTEQVIAEDVEKKRDINSKKEIQNTHTHTHTPSLSLSLSLTHTHTHTYAYNAQAKK